jgi:hypothetical protein
MKQRKLAPGGPIVAAFGLGCVGMSDSYDDRDHGGINRYNSSPAGWSNSKKSKSDARTPAQGGQAVRTPQTIAKRVVDLR